MAFANAWDDTFPPDTEFAYLYAANLRAFRTDIQQRMAAISGLDANKANLNFWDDHPLNTPTDAAKWNGLLFFATDTGKIYQFQYNTTTPSSSWVDITLDIVSVRERPANPRVHLTGSTLNAQPVYTIGFPPLRVTQQIRITILYFETAVTAGGNGLIVYITDTVNSQTVMSRTVVAEASGATHTVIIEGTNAAVSNSQYWLWSDISFPATATSIRNTTIETANGGAFPVYWQAGNSGDVVDFYGALVELL